jgi:TetR/AcrR family transcriptional regulator, multidrug resistance operon repressor
MFIYFYNMRPKNLEKEAAIRTIALQLIADEGLENLTMQKLAEKAHISPRTIYIKYKDKDDLLIKLFIDEVLVTYEKAVLEHFSETLELESGVKRVWLNAFHFFIRHKPSFVLMQYGRSSPLLNKAFKERGIREGHFFAPIHRFLAIQVAKGVILDLPFEAHRALLFAPLLDLVNEYFEHADRPQQIITEELILDCAAVTIKGLLIK